ncbi:MAG TPA: hypothetical protein ENN13_05330 [Candidatus Altiarchaeales archaeon]|nr:hypothetical protein [Candidatus Altiarchaeales archaeon]
MRVVGLIGAIGCGKTAVAEYLVEKHGARYFRFSDILRDVLERMNQPVVRENLQVLGIALRKSFGDGFLAEALKTDLESENPAFAVVDGIRYQDEFDMVKSLGGQIWFVDASPEIRYERAVKRGTRGEKDLSFDEFMKNEMNETERNIQTLGSKADVKIRNESTLEELYSTVEKRLQALH